MLTQFIKFSIVGVLNTTIHYGVFYYLFSVVGIYHLLASGAGFCCAVLNSFVMNRYWTFNTHNSAGEHLFTKFVIVNLLSLSVNLAGMIVLVESLLLNPLLAQLITIVFTLIINFTGTKYWSFR